MYIVVQHDIADTEDFWASAQRNLPRLPEAGVKRVVNLFPSQDMNKCTCVWEADSIENLQRYLNEKLASSKADSLYQINEATAVGLFG